jgi:3-methyladenine DNA glycosylase AlkD
MKNIRFNDWWRDVGSKQGSDKELALAAFAAGIMAERVMAADLIRLRAQNSDVSDVVGFEPVTVPNAGQVANEPTGPHAVAQAADRIVACYRWHKYHGRQLQFDEGDIRGAAVSWEEPKA